MTDRICSAQWPRDNLSVDCFVHEVMNFRYHWHPDQFELNILISGQQYFCRGKENMLLEAEDAVLTGPNTGHASYGQADRTEALVLHFSSRILRQFVRKGEMLSFPRCRPGAAEDAAFRDIRRYAAQTLLALNADTPCSRFSARASLLMLISTLCSRFSPETVTDTPEINEQTQEIIRNIISYMEMHYPEKITLEEISRISQYNRTYISTLFAKATGIGFYDYLTRIRLQHALHDLAISRRTLTDIALGNGFADLKTFNRLFRSLLQCSPREYRAALAGRPVAAEYSSRKIIPCTDPSVYPILRSWADS